MLKLLFNSCFLIALSLASKVSLSEPTTWVIQGHMPKNVTIYQTFKKEVIDVVKERTNGQLILDLKAQGEVMESQGAFSGVKHGFIDGMLMSPQRWGGVNVIFTLIGDVMGAWSNTSQLRQWLCESGADYLQRAYNKHDMQLIGYAIRPHESLISKIPIAGLGDLKGQVMRAPAGMGHELFKRLGAVPRSIDGDKLSGVFKSKSIVMADFGNITNNYDNGLYKLAKHTNYPGFHSMPIADIVVHRDRWDALSPEFQVIVSDATKQWGLTTTKLRELEDKKTLEVLKSEGVTIYQWSEADKKKVREVAASLWDEYAAKDPMAKQMVEDLKAWLRKSGSLD